MVTVTDVDTSIDDALDALTLSELRVVRKLGMNLAGKTAGFSDRLLALWAVIARAADDHLRRREAELRHLVPSSDQRTPDSPPIPTADVLQEPATSLAYPRQLKQPALAERSDHAR